MAHLCAWRSCLAPSAVVLLVLRPSAHPLPQESEAKPKCKREIQKYAGDGREFPEVVARDLPHCWWIHRHSMITQQEWQKSFAGMPEIRSHWQESWLLYLLLLLGPGAIAAKMEMPGNVAWVPFLVAMPFLWGIHGALDTLFGAYVTAMIWLTWHVIIELTWHHHATKRPAGTRRKGIPTVGYI